VRLWGGCVGLGRGEVGGLNLSGLGTDGLGEMAGGRPMVAGVFRSGVVFALVYVAASAALFVGSRWGFVVLLVLSQLVAVWMFVARGRGVGAEVSGGRGAERERLGEIVASVVGWAGVGVAVPVALQVWMFASPVLYPLTAVPVRLRPLYELNPMAGIIESLRRVVLHGVSPDIGVLSVSAVISAILLVLSYGYFKRVESTMADVV